MDAEEGRENERVNLADDLSNRVMVQRDLHDLPLDMRLEIPPRLPITPLILFNHNCIGSWPRQLHFVDFEDSSGRVRNIDPPQHSNVDKLVGSCKGLLCLSLINRSLVSGSLPRSLLIYNPFVGDAVRVPPANPFPYQTEDFGFGFHPRTGEFKVVRFVWVPVDEGEELMVQVFTVGTTEWRDIVATPPRFSDVIGPPEALVEGSLHWVTVVGMEGDDSISGIVSFNLADEVFEEIPHPPCQRFVSREYSLSVLDGCLSAARLVDPLHFDIWVMRQYHVEESWVRQFSFDPNSPGERPPSSRIFPKFICALTNGEILLQNNDNSLVSYDPVENRFETLQINGLPNQFQALPFLPSLFSAMATMNLQL